MTKFAFALLLTACVSTAAMAQAPAASVGVVQSVDGLATVSQGNTMGNLFKEERLLNGARVVTTSTGSAVIRLDNGCVISLAPNQAVTIDSRLDCKALVAGIAGTGVVAAGAAAGAGGGAVMVAFSTVVGIALIANSNSGNSGPAQPASGS